MGLIFNTPAFNLLAKSYRGRTAVGKIEVPSCIPPQCEVERLFGRLKRYRRVGTRYDKLDLTFVGFIHLVLMCEMIRNLV